MPPPIMFIDPGAAGAAIVTYPANFIPGGGADPGAPTIAPAGTPVFQSRKNVRKSVVPVCSLVNIR